MAGSVSVAPFERALMAYCSDVINLQALYGADRAAGPRAALATAREQLATITTQLERLTDAMLAIEDQVFPLRPRHSGRRLESAPQKIRRNLGDDFLRPARIGMALIMMIDNKQLFADPFQVRLRPRTR